MFSPLINTALFSFACAVSAHMEMIQPPPLGSKVNPNTPAESINYNLKSPISASTFPCNVQSLDLLVSGIPVADWPAGSQQSFTISGGVPHNGGSCQAVLSEDGGMTWKVIGEVISGCPVDGKAFPFTVPKSTKSGNALFGWTWFNHTGNREMYMNCAMVRITGGGSGVQGKDMFVANVPGKTQCTTPEGVDITFDLAKDCVGGSLPAGSGSGKFITPTKQPQKLGAGPNDNNIHQQGNILCTPSNPQGYDDGEWPGKYPDGNEVK